MKIGIFFGGQSREREISFAGGRTVFDNLNKDIFEPVPIFIDSLGNFILLDWQYLYKGTIRDFYPPSKFVTNSQFQIYIESLIGLQGVDFQQIIKYVGKPIEPHAFKNHFDFAFLALHGNYGEDGAIQGILEWQNIPYSGCGILPSAIGINKIAQNAILSGFNFTRSKSEILTKTDWEATPYKGDILEGLVARIGLPMVIKAPHQGSSIGVNILTEKDNHRFIELINRAFFEQIISGKKWLSFSQEEKRQMITQITDIREGIGFPLTAQLLEAQNQEKLIAHPEELWHYLDQSLLQNTDKVLLKSIDSEEEVLIERFIVGQEFSCIVIQDEAGKAIALPPTQILKSKDLFDYRMKYLPGMSRKITPIDLPAEQVEAIRQECCRLFVATQGEVYMRIDGFINVIGEIFLNDPNTTSGMLPSSFFFHQAAEIGLNPSQFLTYIIRTSLAARVKNAKKTFFIKQQLAQLDQAIEATQKAQTQKIKVAVVMGGYSTERHISVESGRNIYEKLASSTKYEPIPVFLTGNDEAHKLYEIPINMMLKDNADDIREKIEQWETGQKNPTATQILGKIVQEATSITQKYVAKEVIFEPQKLSYQQLAQKVELVFIALHGRPGEDGALQQQLEKVGLPYNGSGVDSSQITINKFETNEILKQHGISVAKHILVWRKDWETDADAICKQIENEFTFPVICKPADDGCSSAVKKIKNKEQLIAFANMMFREQAPFLENEAQILNLKNNEEFPQKNYFLLEELIASNGARHFLEVTGGLLTKVNEQQELTFEVFEPSETLALGEVLSLEEKFLAGEGQNITPARFALTPQENQAISEQVRNTLQQVAQLLNIEGYARIDAFVRVFDDGKAETIIIEVNSLPGMTPATCIFHQAAINGYKPYGFIDAILTFAQQKKKHLV